MRAREFTESTKQVDEIAPFLAALGGALARGATAAGSALARGAVAAGSKIAQGATQLGNKAVQGAGQLASTAATTAAKTAGTTIGTVGTNKLTGQTGQQTQQTQQAPQAPAVLPPNTKIEPVISKDPSKMGFKIGDANFSLDMKDPKNAQVLQQLGNLAPKQ
jgi:hypothetical protein